MENVNVILSADEGWRRDALKHVAAQLAFYHRAAELRSARKRMSISPAGYGHKTIKVFICFEISFGRRTVLNML
jgi:hypothetical protein